MNNQKPNYSKPSYQKPAAQNQHASVAPRAGKTGSSEKITGLFKSEKGKGWEFKVTEEVAAKLAAIKPGSYLKVYENKSEKTGTEYLSLSVKSVN